MPRDGCAPPARRTRLHSKRSARSTGMSSSAPDGDCAPRAAHASSTSLARNWKVRAASRRALAAAAAAAPACFMPMMPDTMRSMACISAGVGSGSVLMLPPPTLAASSPSLPPSALPEALPEALPASSSSSLLSSSSSSSSSSPSLLLPSDPASDASPPSVPSSSSAGAGARSSRGVVSTDTTASTAPALSRGVKPPAASFTLSRTRPAPGAAPPPRLDSRPSSVSATTTTAKLSPPGMEAASSAHALTGTPCHRAAAFLAFLGVFLLLRGVGAGLAGARLAAAARGRCSRGLAAVSRSRSKSRCPAGSASTRVAPAASSAP